MNPNLYTEICGSTDRDSWLRARGQLLTASDVSALLRDENGVALNPWRAELSLWLEKTGQAPPTEESEAMEWGLRLESPIADAFAEKTGRRVQRHGKLLRSVPHPFLGATLDATTEIDGEVVPLELKTTQKGDDWEDGIPAYYMPQVQTQMLVCGARRASAAVLIAGNRFRWCDVERDEAMIQRILDACGEFWRRVIDNDPPAPDGSEAAGAALRVLYPRETEGKVLALGQEFVALDDRLRDLSSQIKALQAEERKARQLIEAAMGDAEKGVLPGGVGAYQWATQERKAYTVQASNSRVLRRVKK